MLNKLNSKFNHLFLLLSSDCMTPFETIQKSTNFSSKLDLRFRVHPSRIPESVRLSNFYIKRRSVYHYKFRCKIKLMIYCKYFVFRAPTYNNDIYIQIHTPVCKYKWRCHKPQLNTCNFWWINQLRESSVQVTAGDVY